MEMTGRPRVAQSWAFAARAHAVQVVMVRDHDAGAAPARAVHVLRCVEDLTVHRNVDGIVVVPRAFDAAVGVDAV